MGMPSALAQSVASQTVLVSFTKRARLFKAAALDHGDVRRSVCCRVLEGCCVTLGSTQLSFARRSAPQVEQPSTGFTRWSRGAWGRRLWAPWSRPPREPGNSARNQQQEAGSDGLFKTAPLKQTSCQIQHELKHKENFFFKYIHFCSLHPSVLKLYTLCTVYNIWWSFAIFYKVSHKQFFHLFIQTPEKWLCELCPYIEGQVTNMRSPGDVLRYYYFHDEGRLCKTANAFGLSLLTVCCAVSVHLGPKYTKIPFTEPEAQTFTGIHAAHGMLQCLGAINRTQQINHRLCKQEG